MELLLAKSKYRTVLFFNFELVSGFVELQGDLGPDVDRSVQRVILPAQTRAFLKKAGINQFLLGEGGVVLLKCAPAYKAWGLTPANKT